MPCPSNSPTQCRCCQGLSVSLLVMPERSHLRSSKTDHNAHILGDNQSMLPGALYNSCDLELVQLFFVFVEVYLAHVCPVKPCSWACLLVQSSRCGGWHSGFARRICFEFLGETRRVPSRRAIRRSFATKAGNLFPGPGTQHANRKEKTKEWAVGALFSPFSHFRSPWAVYF